ncbi:MAG: DEAD/DEAH box helicase [Proteobacteria bacterium]|nr:DEAD/DEAH box helicase [Pseudomonadota bacterium]
MVNTFKELSLPKSLQISLDKSGFVTPTPIQAQAIPHGLNGEDVIASAQTGTGKTMAFVIPMLAKLIENKEERAIILMPTRELAIQVADVVNKLTSKDMGVHTAVLIGGDAMFKQLKRLKTSPRVIVGTPGRINDHIKRKSLRLGQTSFLVLDETDRMLDMGFGIQIETIIERLHQNRQTLMFSATLPKGIMKVSAKYLENPKKIEIEVDHSDSLRIKQDFLHIQEHAKFDTLMKELEARTGSVVLFVKTKRKVEKIAKELSRNKHQVGYIHGDLRQRQRENVIQRFRDYKCRIMVATDVAARGLDIPHIEHVINYDVPTVPEDYIHRIGRTGRAGAEGSAISFISSDDKRSWADLQHFLDPEAHPKKSGGKGPRRGNGGGGRKRFGKGASFGRGNSSRGKIGGYRGRNSEGSSDGSRSEGGSEGRSFGGNRKSSNGGGKPSGAGRRRSFGKGKGNFGGNSRRSEGNRPSRNA